MQSIDYNRQSNYVTVVMLYFFPLLYLDIAIDNNFQTIIDYFRFQFNLPNNLVYFCEMVPSNIEDHSQC